MVPARGHGGRAAGRARQGCVCGAGYPVRPFEQRNAPARSGGSDGPPARPSGSRAGSQPPARLARRSAEPVNRRSNAGEPTREAARPRGQRCRPAARSALFCPPLHADVHFPGAGREKIWKHSRRNARQTPPAVLSRRSAPPKGRCQGVDRSSPIRVQTRPVRRENGGQKVREAAKRLPPGAARRGKRSGKPDHSEARTGFARADTPGKPLRQGQNAPSLHPGNAQAGRGAALHRRLDTAQTRAQNTPGQRSKSVPAVTFCAYSGCRPAPRRSLKGASSRRR